MNKIILYIATSQDNFIADKNGNVDWMPSPEDPQYQDSDDSCGFNALLDNISTIVMGKNSYEQIITFGPWAWPTKITYVFSNETVEIVDPSIHATDQSPKDFITQYNQKQQGNIWLLGGAQLAASFSQEDLIDEIILTIIPKKIHEGIPLDLPWNNYKLVEKKICVDNLIQKKFIKKATEEVHNA
jgi:dihydrofolate reductase